MDDHLAVNRAHWDERAAAHAASVTYGVEAAIADPERLSSTVRFDLPLLGSVRGQRGVHLQCHIGTDTLSLHRLGARMTGLDFSPVSLSRARSLAAAAGADITYALGDVYSAVEVLGSGFDLVYTGMGALCWLPDITRWAEVVAGLLRPGGRLFLREAHPMLWAFEVADGRLDLRYPYFSHVEPVIVDVPETYVETDAVFTANETRTWNHGLGEIVSALMAAGLRLDGLVEHDSVPWEALPGLMSCSAAGEWRLRDQPSRMACSYTLRGTRL